jgi:hypothetical protein
MTRKMTIHDVAGYCHETALWKLLADVSAALLVQPAENPLLVTPSRVVVEGDTFLWDVAADGAVAPEFLPPEGGGRGDEAALVWSLGAVACYASSGHVLFGGRGGAYQRSHPQVELPVLRKDHAALTPLVRRCLCYNPSQRISLSTLCTAAQEGWERSLHQERRLRQQPAGMPAVPADRADALWPEKM